MWIVKENVSGNYLNYVIGLEDSFEVIDNETPPQKRRSTKEKVMIRTHDPSTLVTLSAEQWQDIFRIVSERSVVQTINTGAVAVAGPIFDINKQVSSQVRLRTCHCLSQQILMPFVCYFKYLSLIGVRLTVSFAFFYWYMIIAKHKINIAACQPDSLSIQKSSNPAPNVRKSSGNPARSL